jgi:hypothetical protein
LYLSTDKVRIRVSNKLITVASCSEPIEGHLLRTRLEAEGIRCFVADEHTVSANWFYSNAIGGVKLQVRESDLDSARDILISTLEEREQGGADFDWSAINPDWTFDDEDQPGSKDQYCCPQCDSTEVFYQKFSKPWVFLSILLLGIPLPFLSREWSCRSCGATWKQKLF